MASSKGVIRSIVVLALVLAAGFSGLWFLGGSDITIKNQNNPPAKIAANKNTGDEFSDFGGKTPQETIKLFISALEKNDLTLAAKYFVSENRETVSEDLSKLSDANFLGDLVADLKNIKSGGPKNDSRFYFEIIDKNDQITTELELLKNQNGLWKIVSL